MANTASERFPTPSTHLSEAIGISEWFLFFQQQLARGAFTGANRLREGRFESADGGTLFLDELGLMPLAVQEKLVRVVEYGTFERQ